MTESVIRNCNRTQDAETLTEDLSSLGRNRCVSCVNPTKCMMNYEGKPSFISLTDRREHVTRGPVPAGNYAGVSCKTSPPLKATYSPMALALSVHSLQRAMCLPAVGPVGEVVSDGWAHIQGPPCRTGLQSEAHLSRCGWTHPRCCHSRRCRHTTISLGYSGCSSI